MLHQQEQPDCGLFCLYVCPDDLLRWLRFYNSQREQERLSCSTEHRESYQVHICAQCWVGISGDYRSLKYCGISGVIVFVIKWLFPCLQLTSGEVWVQFNDGSQLVVQAGVSCITYTSPDGRITKYNIAIHSFFLTSQNTQNS